MIKMMRIPEERISVLIGKNGQTKKQIEKMTKTKIIINDEISISGDPINVMCAENIIRAIGRGFSPDIAKNLIDENKDLYIIVLPKNENKLKRIKSRIIGTKGKCRKKIEMFTKTYICVYGKTVSIIGEYDNIEKARKAIEKLINGVSHKNVYKFLESNDR
ncbi:MAG: KH domain-containing protein [Candidatus Aenigmatarchaeota archaeon]